MTGQQPTTINHILATMVARAPYIGYYSSQKNMDGYYSSRMTMDGYYGSQKAMNGYYGNWGTYSSTLP